MTPDNPHPREEGEDLLRICPACGRSIIIERGRWTVHTDPRTWGTRGPAERCLNAGKVFTHD